MQAAFLTYQLLGGEPKKDGQVKRWFKPVNGLGNAGNSVLYRGLQGSPLFENSECFFHKLKSAIQSAEGKPWTLPARALAIQEISGTNAIIRRFNRDTVWLATGVLGALVFAALVLAILVQERQPKTVDPADSATLFKDMGLSGKRSTGKITSGQAANANLAFTKISPQEIPSSQMEAAASIPTPALASLRR